VSRQMLCPFERPPAMGTQTCICASNGALDPPALVRRHYKFWSFWHIGLSLVFGGRAETNESMVGACLVILGALPRTNPNGFAADTFTPTRTIIGRQDIALNTNNQELVVMYERFDLFWCEKIFLFIVHLVSILLYRRSSIQFSVCCHNIA
jgi:hypothetical protein